MHNWQRDFSSTEPKFLEAYKKLIEQGVIKAEQFSSNDIVVNFNFVGFDRFDLFFSTYLANILLNRTNFCFFIGVFLYANRF